MTQYHSQLTTDFISILLLFNFSQLLQHNMYLAVSKMPEHNATLAAIVTGTNAARIDEWMRDQSNIPKTLDIVDVPTLRFNCTEILSSTSATYIKTDLMLVRSVADPLQRGYDHTNMVMAPMVRSHSFMIIKTANYHLESFSANGHPVLIPDVNLPHNLLDRNKVLMCTIIKLPSPVIPLGPLPAAPANGPPPGHGNNATMPPTTQAPPPTNINIHLDPAPGPSRLRRGSRDRSSSDHRPGPMRHRSNSGNSGSSLVTFPITNPRRPIEGPPSDDEDDFQPERRHRSVKKGGK